MPTSRAKTSMNRRWLSLVFWTTSRRVRLESIRPKTLRANPTAWWCSMVRKRCAPSAFSKRKNRSEDLCAAPFAKFDSRWPPQRFQINVRIGQFIGWYAQKRVRATGSEMDTDCRRVLFRVDHEGAVICPRNYSAREPLAARRSLWIIDTKFIFVEIDH
jgi:hypothetical protein